MMDITWVMYSWASIMDETPGYVGRDRIVQLWEPPDGYDYLMDPKRRKRERRFGSREEAVEYLRREMHLATDDLQFMYWFSYTDDLPRHILTGELVKVIVN